MKMISTALILLIVMIPMSLLAVTEDWVYRYDGPEHLDDRSSSVIFGSDGQIYTAGYSYIGAAYRALVIGLTPSGGQRWIYSYDVWGYEDAFNDLVEGGDGDLYAAGYSDLGAGAAYDVIIASIDRAGNEQWTFRYDSGMNTSDMAKSITVDPMGDLYTTGYSWDSQVGDYVPLVVSVDSTGQFRWAYRPVNLPGFANHAVYGPDGNLYITAYVNGDYGSTFTVISLTTDGQERWVYSPLSALGGASSIAFDPQGNLYTSGKINNLPAIVSLDPAGKERWIYAYDDSLLISGSAGSIAWADGNLFTAGTAYYPIETTYYDWLVIGVDTSGQEIWAYRYDYLGGSDTATALTWDSQTRRLYVTGYSYQTILPVVSLDTNGQERWIYSYDYGPYDDAYAIASNGGNIAVAGESGDWDSEDLTVIRLTEGPVVKGRKDRIPQALP